MTKQMVELLKDLADVLEKHKGGLHYTTADDGIRVTQGLVYKPSVCINWPFDGNVDTLRSIISNAVIDEVEE